MPRLAPSSRLLSMHWAKNDTTPGVKLGLYRAHKNKSSYLKPQGIEP